MSEGLFKHHARLKTYNPSDVDSLRDAIEMLEFFADVNDERGQEEVAEAYRDSAMMLRNEVLSSDE